MNYVYRYTDLADGIIKYVGISCRGSLEDGCLKRRFNEHCNTDWWMQGKTWMIEYIEVPTKNDAHALEVQHCLKVVNSFLKAEDYSRFDKETLLADKKELEYREEVFISFQLGKKLYLC